MNGDFHGNTKQALMSAPTRDGAYAHFSLDVQQHVIFILNHRAEQNTRSILDAHRSPPCEPAFEQPLGPGSRAWHSEPMSAPPPTSAARIAATVAFFTNGALLSTLMARYAEVKQALGLSPLLFGLVVVGAVLGGVLAGQTPALAIRRLGTARTSAIGTTALAAGITVAAIGVTLGQTWMLAAGLILSGFLDAAVDVAQNSQALRIQSALGRSIITRMHAGWSAGAATGAAVGTAAAAWGVPLLIHTAAWGALCAIAVVIAARHYLPDAGAPVDAPAGAPTTSRRRHPALLLAPLALIAVAGITVEEVANNWSAVYLATERPLPLSMAGIGLSVILGAQFVGRFLGDIVIDALGTHTALRLGLGMVTLGLIGGIWTPWTIPALALWGLAGLGSSVTVPIAFTEADTISGLKPQTGVTLVSWSMRIMTLALSPSIGAAAAAFSLPIALTGTAAVAAMGWLATLALRRH